MNPTDLAPAILDQAPTAIIVSDPDGLIRLWNAAAERTFGFTAADAIGQSLDLIIPEPLRAPHWAGYRRVMAGGEPRLHGRALPTKALTADGRTIYVELAFAVLRGPDGAILGAIATGHDISARWAEEKALRAQLRALTEKP